ncbi:MAG TPA: alpha-L-rhamnosidase C-terminal domain-containing protein [Fimbriimonadaceae bacterium]|jgi:hypothetical protein
MSNPNSIGPIQLTDKRPLVNALGVQAAAGTTTPAKADGFKTRGQWIWPTGSNFPTRFRKTFDLQALPSEAEIYASAECSYRLWINGHLVSRGPADAGRDYDTPAPGPWFDDVRNVARFLKPGENAIAAEVFPTPLVSSEGSTGHPGLKVDLRVGDEDIATDETWRYHTADDLAHHEGPNGFFIDAELEPVGWQGAGFKDEAWPMAQICANSRPADLTSELAPPLEAVVPATGTTRVTQGVEANPDGSATFQKDGGYAIRYPRVMSARVALQVEGHKGARLLIMPNEANAPGYNRHAEILLREGQQTIELPFLDSFSTINIEAKGVKGPIKIDWVKAIFCSYPIHYKGSFECDNPELNKVWNVCRWVTQICMQTHYLDSPHHHEPISDAGDYLIESLNGYYAFGEANLARQDLRKIARTLEQRHFQSFHTSYSLLWVRMLMQYYEYTGDASLPIELAKPVHQLLDRFETYIGKNGLISNAPNYMFMDWVTIDGFECHHPPAVIGQGYMTALYYQALGDDKRVSELEKNEERASHDELLRTQIKEAFNRELWNETEGLYRDGKPFQSDVKPHDWLPADKDIETFSTQGNTFAVTCGLADSERAKAIMRKLLARAELNCQPYFMHFVFEALAKTDLFNELAPAQLARWKILPDSQSFYEMWDTGDRSHAWNATPLFQMSGVILGVKPLEPGFKTFAISPNPSGLKWAKGAVPTPHGDIEVSWQIEGPSLKVEFRVPMGTEAICEGKRYGPGSHQIAIPH